MTPRRLLLLAAVLLTVQLGALLHGLSHMGRDDGRQQDGGPHAACAWCLAYAGLDDGLTGQPPALPARMGPPPVQRVMPRPRPSLPVLPYRSRAPPLRLA